MVLFLNKQTGNFSEEKFPRHGCGWCWSKGILRRTNEAVKDTAYIHAYAYVCTWKSLHVFPIHPFQTKFGDKKKLAGDTRESLAACRVSPDFFVY